MTLDDHFDIDEVRRQLVLARQLARQGSYQRRLPSPAGTAQLGRIEEWCRARLREVPTDWQALDAMAHVRECLLDYVSSEEYLDQAVRAGLPNTRKVKRRLLHIRQAAQEWRDLGLSPAQLDELGAYLEGCHAWESLARERSRARTDSWLDANCPATAAEVRAALDRRGAFSDWQVLANVVKG